MLRPLLVIILGAALAACAATQPDTAPTAAPPEVNVVSDYPPVKAAVVPIIRDLGYSITRDAQYWTEFEKPGGLDGTRPTRLTVTFASIRTHTRVIADTQWVVDTAQGRAAVPAPDHPDRGRIQAALQQARQQIERRPLRERHAPAPPPTNVPPMTGAPRAAVDQPTSARPTASPVASPAPSAQPTASSPTQPGQTRVRVDEPGGFRLPW